MQKIIILITLLPFFIGLFLISLGSIYHNISKKQNLILFLLSLICCLYSFFVYRTVFLHEFFHSIIEFFRFFITLFSLYFFASFIRINVKTKIDYANVFLLILGVILSAYVGTLASSAIILPNILFYNKNEKQYKKVFLLCLLIIVVANLSGAYSVFGDAPLVFAMLNGLDNDWVLQNLAPTSSFISFFLIFIYYIFSQGKKIFRLLIKNILHFIILLFFFLTIVYPKKYLKYFAFIPSPGFFLKIINKFGKYNFIILSFLFSTIQLVYFFAKNYIYKEKNKKDYINNHEGKQNNFLNFKFQILEIENKKEFLYIFICNILFSLITNLPIALQVISYISVLQLCLYSYIVNEKTDKKKYYIIQELFFIFFFLFITLIPVFILINNNIKNINLNGRFIFWPTAFISGFLDNTPTFIIITKLFGGLSYLVKNKPEVLRQICLGAVFGGSLTYIGNAPNILILGAAKMEKIKMPNFFFFFIITTVVLTPLWILSVHFFS